MKRINPSERTSTSANVAFPGLFHTWGEQVIAGIGWELACRAVELVGDVAGRCIGSDQAANSALRVAGV
ncbi:hypothetical protein [Streptomyces sp. NPDC056255]|uniref:hypothetical protein n=1 Tax=Streptomyces sp. NPDC056255 TaxID=3345764 RepID=UPI0035D7CBED